MDKINFGWGLALAGDINQDQKVSIMSSNLDGIRYLTHKNTQIMHTVGFCPNTNNAYSDAPTTGTVHAIC